MTRERDRWLPWLLAGCVACLLFASLMLTVVISMTYDPPPGTEPPKVTDWMQGWGSIVGVVAGAAAAVAASWLLLHERQQAREAQAQLREERAEAALVAPRAIQYSRLATEIYRLTGSPWRVHINLSVTNYGAEPVRRVVVIVRSPRSSATWVLPATEVIEPHDVKPSTGSYMAPDDLLAPDLLGQPLPDPQVTIRFFDSLGQEWSRVNNGPPTRVFGPLPEGEPLD